MIQDNTTIERPHRQTMENVCTPTLIRILIRNGLQLWSGLLFLELWFPYTDAWRMEESIHAEWNWEPRGFSIGISDFKPLIWISLGQNFLPRVSDLGVSHLSFTLLVFSNLRNCTNGEWIPLEPFQPLESSKRQIVKDIREKEWLWSN